MKYLDFIRFNKEVQNLYSETHKIFLHSEIHKISIKIKEDLNRKTPHVHELEYSVIKMAILPQ